jgi:triosephosphate isomerase
VGGFVEGVDIAVCPPFPYLQQAGDVLSGSGVLLGAQDVSAYQEALTQVK